MTEKIIIQPLSDVEKEVAQLLPYGWTNAAMAEEMGFSEGKLCQCIDRIRVKCNASTRIEAMMKMLALGVIDNPFIGWVEQGIPLKKAKLTRQERIDAELKAFDNKTSRDLDRLIDD